MYKRHCILALAFGAERARSGRTVHALMDTFNETDERMGYAEARAILFTRALSQLDHRMRVAKSF